jgi:CBS domain-containing protein
MNMTSLFAKPVTTVGPKTPLKTAARLMRKHNVGALVVTEQDRPEGIVTDRDIALAVCERDLTPETPIQAVMTVPVETLRQEEGVYDATRKMMELGVRRLPVVDDMGRVVGLVSLDLLLMLSRALNQLAEGIHPAPEVV